MQSLLGKDSHLLIVIFIPFSSCYYLSVMLINLYNFFFTLEKKKTEIPWYFNCGNKSYESSKFFVNKEKFFSQQPLAYLLVSQAGLHCCENFFIFFFVFLFMLWYGNWILQSPGKCIFLFPDYNYKTACDNLSSAFLRWATFHAQYIFTALKIQTP